MYLNWTWHKIGQGQPGVMFYINFVVLQSMMLHTKFQGNWPNGSGKEDFLRFWAFLSMTAILVMWPWPFVYHYFFSSNIGFIWNTFSLSPIIFWKNGLQFFYQNFSTQMTLAKVTKWPWPLAFISDWLDFISIPKSTITTQKWKILAFPIQMPMEPKLTLP